MDKAEQVENCDFESLVREHQSMVFSIAYHFLHDRGLAEEVAQETLLRLHRNLSSLQSAAHAGFWLRRVAVQRSIDAGRRRKRRPVLSLEDVTEPAAIANGSDPIAQETLRRLVASLPEMPKMVMILRFQEDLQPLEIAEALEMPVATVKSHLQRSLAMLREKLKRRGLGRRPERFEG